MTTTVVTSLLVLATLTHALEMESLDGGGWQLVRRVKPGLTWHPAADGLKGTDVYGPPGGSTDDVTFSVAFPAEFDQFLFATGDGEKWLICNKDAVLGGLYENADRPIVLSSNGTTSAKWYHRSTYPEDPWVSLTDHWAAIPTGDIVYGEASSAEHASAVLPAHNGANVYVRKAPKLESLDGGGWQLVRRVKPGLTWHPATDSLNGTDVYGTPAGSTANATFSVAFPADFDQFLFATGDGEKWLICNKDAVLGGLYENADRPIVLSSNGTTSAKWYHRSTYPEDPWVSLTDHWAAIPTGDILYGEASIGDHASAVLPAHNGANVYVRKAPQALQLISEKSGDDKNIKNMMPRVSSSATGRIEVWGVITTSSSVVVLMLVALSIIILVVAVLALRVRLTRDGSGNRFGTRAAPQSAASTTTNPASAMI